MPFLVPSFWNFFWFVFLQDRDSSFLKLVITYFICSGYMAPEYLMHGHLSEKADVFSYGVVMMELITGHRNSSFDLDANGLLDWVNF